MLEMQAWSPKENNSRLLAEDITNQIVGQGYEYYVSPSCDNSFTYALTTGGKSYERKHLLKGARQALEAFRARNSDLDFGGVIISVTNVSPLATWQGDDQSARKHLGQEYSRKVAKGKILIRWAGGL